LTRGALTMAVLCLLLIVGFQPAEARTETVLYTFCAQTGCPDGSNPRADLVLDTAGNLYGTTLYVLAPFSGEKLYGFSTILPNIWLFSMYSWAVRMSFNGNV
jgi:hypothetical protein